MTPQEKAQEICNKMLFQIQYNAQPSTVNGVTKECALIVVNELIESHLLLTTTHDQEPSIRCKTYWQKVKSEIEKL